MDKNVPWKRIRIRNPESGKFLLVEPGIVGFGVQNTAEEESEIPLTVEN